MAQPDAPQQPATIFDDLVGYREHATAPPQEGMVLAISSEVVVLDSA